MVESLGLGALILLRVSRILLIFKPSVMRLSRDAKRSTVVVFSKPRACPPIIPVIDWDGYTHQTESGRALIAIAGFVYDITDFIERHPGGHKILRAAIGQDATAMFHGGVFPHSAVASSLLSTMRVYVIRDGGRRESSKKDSIGQVDLG
jgi:predicted heme/steroid binding protein